MPRLYNDPHINLQDYLTFTSTEASGNPSATALRTIVPAFPDGRTIAKAFPRNVTGVNERKLSISVGDALPEAAISP
jgi:hypothetical protein